MITAAVLTLIVTAIATSQAVRLLRNLLTSRPAMQSVETR
jgi:hypothetical protein